ncbi:MAG: hypothetical protein ACI3ZL_09965 [Candidatus Cryptobacteroides sp.]
MEERLKYLLTEWAQVDDSEGLHEDVRPDGVRTFDYVMAEYLLFTVYLIAG